MVSLSRSRPYWALSIVLLLLASVFASAPEARAGGSSINVDTFEDELNEDGDCSLREAIQSANTATAVDGCNEGTDGLGDMINVPAGTYNLTRSNDGFPENGNETGDLDITDAVLIQAIGGRAVIDAGFDLGIENGRVRCDDFFNKYDTGLNDRVMHVMDSNVTLLGLTITGGHVSSDGEDTTSSGGGGIYANDFSDLTLTDVRVRRNAAVADGEGSESGGGGVYVRGRLVMREGSRADENAVVFAEFGAGGGVAVEAQQNETLGTASEQRGTLGDMGGRPQGAIQDARVDHNIICTEQGVGGGVATNSSLVVDTSQIDANYMEGFATAGGGIAGANYGDSSPNIVVRRTEVIFNETAGFFQNAGGGIFNEGMASVEKSTVADNTVHRGALLGIEGDAGPAGSSSGGIGGGIANINGLLGVDRSTIARNTTIAESEPRPVGSPQPQGTGEGPDSFGGGLYSDNGLVFVDNSTIARNEADRGGGAYLFAFGGGKGGFSSAEFEHVTVARNEAEIDGGGLDATVDGGNVSVDSSIVGENVPNDCGTTAIESDDWNIVSDDSCDFNEEHDLLNRDPRLNGLANNGGPTETMLPDDDSPAVDHVGQSDPKSNNGCPSPSVDQRGTDRPQDGDGNGSKRCDAGAVELEKEKQQPFCEGFKNDPRNQIIGTNETDTLVGTDGPDIICGKKGGDTIRGGDGNDILLGYEGNDDMSGGKGNDKIRAGKQNDEVDGGGGDDTMHSGGADDRIFGGPGDDLIQGHTGEDHLDGESGDDRVEGHEHSDDIFGGSGEDVGLGGGQNDDIMGQEGDDKLRGLQGSDDLNGGPDTDDCDPGEGAGQAVLNCES
jgi:CSLREA domain-containing protein